MGRPSLYSQELIETIAERLSKGEPMASICRDEGMPHPSTVWDWTQADAAVSQIIARARLAGFDAIAANARETARGKGESTEDVQRDKLIIETDLKLLAKWDPKRYGDRMTLAGDADNPVMGMTEAQVDTRLAVLQAKLLADKPDA